MERQSQKQEIRAALSRIRIPANEENYGTILSALHIRTSMEISILRSVVQDEVYRRRRQGEDWERADRFLKWLWTR